MNSFAGSQLSQDIYGRLQLVFDAANQTVHAQETAWVGISFPNAVSQAFGHSKEVVIQDLTSMASRTRSWRLWAWTSMASTQWNRYIPMDWIIDDPWRCGESSWCWQAVVRQESDHPSFAEWRAESVVKWGGVKKGPPFKWPNIPWIFMGGKETLRRYKWFHSIYNWLGPTLYTQSFVWDVFFTFLEVQDQTKNNHWDDPCGGFPTSKGQSLVLACFMECNGFRAVVLFRRMYGRCFHASIHAYPPQKEKKINPKIRFLLRLSRGRGVQNWAPFLWAGVAPTMFANLEIWITVRDPIAERQMMIGVYIIIITSLA